MKIAHRIQQLAEILTSKGVSAPLLVQLIDKLSFDITELERQIDILTEAGAEIHQEKEQKAIMEIILNSARKLTMADAGTLYLVEEEYLNDHYNPGQIISRVLQFEVLQNDTMGVYLKRTEKSKIFLPPVSLEVEGQPNHKNVSAHCALTGEIVNIEDVYHAQGFDFSGTKKYDDSTGYRSKSMLVLPLRDHQFEIIGVMQLINRKTKDGQIIPFTSSDLAILQAISYQAAVTLTTQKLVKEQVDLFNSFVQVLAEGLGEKAKYHYGHINRVAGLTLNLAEAVTHWGQGIYQGVQFSPGEMDELRLAGWMHDIGKLTTPENVVSKQLKLEVMINRMEVVCQRYNSKLKDLQIAELEARLAAAHSGDEAELQALLAAQAAEREQLMAELNEINSSNFGGEFLADPVQAMVDKARQTQHQQWLDLELGKHNDRSSIMKIHLLPAAQPEPLLNDEEHEHLSIKRGTLSASERQVVNDHADRSWRWLFKLPFPKKMKKLPLYAAAHHETLNGKGYPIGLKAEQLPMQARIIAIADIFEALTASDRPYKQPMKLSKAVEILGFMVKDNHLDAEVARIFIESGLYLEWAKGNLQESQIDTVDAAAWVQRFYPAGFDNSLPGYQKDQWNAKA